MKKKVSFSGGDPTVTDAVHLIELFQIETEAIMSFTKTYFGLILIIAALSCRAAIVEEPVKHAEFLHTQQQLQKLENELTVHQGTLQARFDANDKRISDFGVLVTMQGTQTTSVGNLISLTGISITIIAFLAGLFTYFSATAKAKKEAQDAVKEWIHQETTAFRAKIVSLENDVKIAQNAIAKLRQEAEADIDKQMGIFRRKAEIAIQGVVVNATLEEKVTIDPIAANAMQQVSDELKAQPAMADTAFGHYVRGMASLANGDMKNALNQFEIAMQLAPNAEPSEKIKYLFGKGMTLHNLGRADEAIAVYDELDRLYCSDKAPAVREEVARALLNKGLSLFESERFNDALLVYGLVVERYRDDDAPLIREQVASAMVNRGIVFHKLGKLTEQITEFDTVDAVYGTDAAEGLRDRVSGALLNKAIALADHGKEDEALELYDTINSRYHDDPTPQVRGHVVQALVNKGATLGKIGQPLAAKEVLEEVETRYGSDQSPSIRLQLANALFNRGCASREVGDYQGEIFSYDAIDERFAGDNSPEMRQQVAKALFNKAVAIGKRNNDSNYSEEIGIHETIVRRYGNDEVPAVKEEVAKALCGVGFAKMMRAKQAYESNAAQCSVLLAEALSSFNRSLQISPLELRPIVYGNLGYVQFLAGRREEAEEFTRQCLELGGGKMLAAQHKDSRLYRVASIDSKYEELLDSLWIKVGPRG